MNPHPEKRPDAGIRAEMPASVWSNPAAPIILGIIVTIFLFFLILLLMGVMPLEAFKGDTKETKKVDAAVSIEEEQAMNRINTTGSLYPNEPPAQPDPILSKIDAPFQAEENKEEQQMDS
ncbi:hypothetical protein [Methanospirillum lacunae]|uniref:Uncharacterized protein n=1 Tax=Methanospirillum lacunae TaxID=668570 RepID=A0A2V2N166_9EURY|nr:hypothetical protein [Methanospirillum lacunae]PWR72305.1 hypothetical protein DK846_10055 [Methanospirillum lacunae]